MKTLGSYFWFTVVVFALALRSAVAAPTAIALSVSTEDGSKMLVATVTSGGTPVANTKINFYVRRTFGQLELGSDTTLDDGTAAVAFPSTLPGDGHGELQLGAEIEGRPGSQVRAVLPGGVAPREPSANVPRALWSSRAPYALLASVGLLVAVVWGAFAYAAFQLCGIRMAANAPVSLEADLPKNTAVTPQPEISA